MLRQKMAMFKKFISKFFEQKLVSAIFWSSSSSSSSYSFIAQ